MAATPQLELGWSTGGEECRWDNDGEAQFSECIGVGWRSTGFCRFAIPFLFVLFLDNRCRDILGEIKWEGCGHQEIGEVLA